MFSAAQVRGSLEACAVSDSRVISLHTSWLPSFQQRTAHTSWYVPWDVAVAMLLNFIKSAIATWHGRASVVDVAWLPDPQGCVDSPHLRRFRGLTQFLVSDWLTLAPSRVPNAGLTLSPHANESSKLEAEIKEAVFLADHQLAKEGGCSSDGLL